MLPTPVIHGDTLAFLAAAGAVGAALLGAAVADGRARGRRLAAGLTAAAGCLLVALGAGGWSALGAGILAGAVAAAAIAGDARSWPVAGGILVLATALAAAGVLELRGGAPDPAAALAIAAAAGAWSAGAALTGILRRHPGHRVVAGIGAGGIAIVAIGGAAVAELAGRQAEARDRGAIAERARTLAAALDAEAVGGLTGTAADQADPAWQRLHRILAGMRGSIPDSRYCCLLRLRADGTVVFLVDGTPPGAADFSPPGAIYPEAENQPETIAVLRTPGANCQGPYADGFGRWISGNASVVDAGGRVVAGLSLDLPAAQIAAGWAGQRRAFLALAGALLCGLGIALAALWRERRRVVHLRRRHRLEQVIADAGRDLVTDTDTAAALERLLPAVGSAAGVERARLIRFAPDDAFAPVRTWRSTHCRDEQSDRIDLDAVRRLVDGAHAGAMQPGTVGADLATAAVVPVPLAGRAWGALILEDRDGERTWDAGELAALRTLGAAIGGAVARQEIESRLRQAKDQAERSAEHKADFLATMSHEIRTPLGGILGMSALLAEARLEGDAREQVATIQGCAEGLLGIVDDILDYSKIEAGRLEIEHIPFSPRDVIEDAMAAVAARAQARGTALACAFAAAVPARVLGDPTRLRQVAVNLLAAAIGRTERGEIVMRCDCAADGDSGVLQCSLADTGAPIPPQAQAELFAPIAGAPRPAAGGSSLGLAIAKRLVELMGGIISVDPAAGPGATIRFSVRTGILAPAPARPFAGDRALVVEPLPRIAASLVDQLTALGMQAAACATLDEAMADARAHAPRAIVLADTLPEGPAAARALARAGAHGRPLILLTVAGGRPGATPADSLVAGVLQRPVRPSRLATALIGGEEPPATWTASHGHGLRLHGRVLVAEDNEANARVFAAVLARAGLEVATASDGVQAVAACAQGRFDCILMDIEMPEMDGITAARLIRSREAAGRRTPIIAVTANAFRHDRERTAGAGMDDHLRKPVEPEILLAAVQRALAGRGDDPFAAVGGSSRIERPSTRHAEGGVALDADILDRLGRHLGGGGLLALVDEYDRRAADEFAALFAALDAGDAERVRQESHRLGSGAGALGLVRLMAALRALERAARSGELPERAAARIRAELERGQAALREYRQR